MLHTPPWGPPSASASPLPTTQVRLSREPPGIGGRGRSRLARQADGPCTGTAWRSALLFGPKRGGSPCSPSIGFLVREHPPATLGDQGEQWGGAGGLGLPMGLLLDGKTRGICGPRQVFRGPETDPAASPWPVSPQGRNRPSLSSVGRRQNASESPLTEGNMPTPLVKWGPLLTQTRAGKGPHGPPSQLKKGGLDSYHLPFLGLPPPSHGP